MNQKKIKDKLNSGLKWCQDNKEVLVIGIPLFTAVIAAVTKIGGKAINVYQEKNLQNKSIYDHSLGTYWNLRHPLSNGDRLLIEQRRAAGEKLGDILRDMRLLK